MIFLSFAENYKNMSTLSVFTKTLFFMHWEGGKDKKNGIIMFSSNCAFATVKKKLVEYEVTCWEQKYPFKVRHF